MRVYFTCILLLLNSDVSHNVPLRSRQDNSEIDEKIINSTTSDESAFNKTSYDRTETVRFLLPCQVDNSIFRPDINIEKNNFLTIYYGFHYKNDQEVCSGKLEDSIRAIIENRLLEIIYYLNTIKFRYFSFITYLSNINCESIIEKESRSDILLELDFSLYGRSKSLCNFDDISTVTSEQSDYENDNYGNDEYLISVEEEECIELPVSVESLVEHTTTLSKEWEEQTTSISSIQLIDIDMEHPVLVEEEATSNFRPFDHISTPEPTVIFGEQCDEQSTPILGYTVDISTSSESMNNEEFCEEQSIFRPVEITLPEIVETLEDSCIEQSISTTERESTQYIVVPEILESLEEECDEQVTFTTPSSRPAYPTTLENSVTYIIEPLVDYPKVITSSEEEWEDPAIYTAEVTTVKYITKISEKSIDEKCIEQSTTEQEHYKSLEEICQEELIYTTIKSFTELMVEEESSEEECEELLPFTTVSSKPAHNKVEDIVGDMSEPLIIKFSHETSEELTYTTEATTIKYIVEASEEVCEEQLVFTSEPTSTMLFTKISNDEKTSEEDYEEQVTFTTLSSRSVHYKVAVDDFVTDVMEPLVEYPILIKTSEEQSGEQVLYTSPAITIKYNPIFFKDSREEEWIEQFISTTETNEPYESVEEACEEQSVYNTEPSSAMPVTRIQIEEESSEEECEEQFTFTTPSSGLLTHTIAVGDFVTEPLVEFPIVIQILEEEQIIYTPEVVTIKYIPEFSEKSSEEKYIEQFISTTEATSKIDLIELEQDDNESLEEVCKEQVVIITEPTSSMASTQILIEKESLEEECEEQFMLTTLSSRPAHYTSVVEDFVTENSEPLVEYPIVIKSSEKECEEQAIYTPEEQLILTTLSNRPAHYTSVTEDFVTEISEPNIVIKSSEKECEEQVIYTPEEQFILTTLSSRPAHYTNIAEFVSNIEVTSKTNVIDLLEPDYNESSEEVCREQLVFISEPNFPKPFTEILIEEESTEEEYEEQLAFTTPSSRHSHYTGVVAEFGTMTIKPLAHYPIEEQFEAQANSSSVETNIKDILESSEKSIEQECMEQFISSIDATSKVDVIEFLHYESSEERCEEQLVLSTEPTPRMPFTETLIEEESSEEECEEQITFTTPSRAADYFVTDINEPLVENPPKVIKTLEEECEEQFVKECEEGPDTIEQTIIEKCEEQMTYTDQHLTESLEEECIEQYIITTDTPFHSELFESSEEECMEQVQEKDDMYKVLNISIRVKEQDECKDIPPDRTCVPVKSLDFDVTYNPSSLEDVINVVEKNVKCYNCIDTNEIHVENGYTTADSKDRIFLQLLRYLAKSKQSDDETDTHNYYRLIH